MPALMSNLAMATSPLSIAKSSGVGFWNSLSKLTLAPCLRMRETVSKFPERTA